MIPAPLTAGSGWPWQAAKGRPIRRVDGLPRISVVVPSFEQGAYLESAIRSVLLQGYPDLELMVVDGASSDTSAGVIEHYRQHLTWAPIEPDRGQAHAINKGFARATGSVLGWLNADDILLPGSLRSIGRAFARRPHLDAVAGLRRELASDGNLGECFVRDRPSARHLRRYCCLAQETVYFSHRVYQRLGGLEESRDFALDYEYWLRMIAYGFRFTLLPAYLGAMRDHPATKRATRDGDRRDDLRVLAARYRLGINEEDAWLRGGLDHTVRLALLEDLCRSPLARSPRLMLEALRLLDWPTSSAAAIALYRRYRLRRPRGAGGPSGRLAAAVGTLVDALLRRPLGAGVDPADPAADPLLNARLEPADLRALGGAPDAVAEDTLALGSGWSWPEQTRARPYRWARSGAELHVLRPTGDRHQLRLELEIGPSLGWQSTAVELIDEAERTVARGRIDSSGVWLAALPLARGPLARTFRIAVPAAQGRPASAEDPRVLDFRATSIAWHG